MLDSSNRQALAFWDCNFALTFKTLQDEPFSALAKPELFDILSDMKTVTLRALRRDSCLLDSAASGQEFVVTRFGKPYVRIGPANQPRSFLGAGAHLGLKKPVSPDPIPALEWKGLG